MWQINLLLALGATTWSGGALAHVGEAHVGNDQALYWTWEPGVQLLLLIASIWYLLGWLRLRREGNLARALGKRRAVSFAAGIGILVIALASPLDVLAASLFSAHMTQHLLLMLVAPPLLVWGRPVYIGLWAFPLQKRKRIGRYWVETGRLRSVHAFLMRPTVVWLSASLALWFWHIPGPYEWALSSEVVHTLEHLTFFTTSLAFWTLTMDSPATEKGGCGIALILIATFAMHNGLLGALLTFAPSPLYRSYSSPAFGFSPLEDQQLAGLIMWVPASFIHLAALVLLFVGWMAQIKAYSR